MERLTDIARSMNRPLPVVRALQAKLGLPILRGDRYPAGYVVFLRKVMALRQLGVGEDRIVRLFQLEQKLMRVMNADAVDSETWFLDFVVQVGGGARRLLLTNFDVGCELDSSELQPGLALAQREKELFKTAQMGEDALRILRKYLNEYRAVIDVIRGELPLLRGALAWGSKLVGKPGVAVDKTAKTAVCRRTKRRKGAAPGQLLPGLG